ncbi:YlxQ-related RNA-binding protein [Fructilactobacillus cliffordii]|uniref:YlxQ-related RNA-binding protein n=1 Tax=Fructilactobacillus cliffordii TaxID=2940299 RepID=A0A9Q8ZTZ7_9LACO|nr:YlxQ-related RNA-binding protein [Fructilactobacillus cliffordii]USS86566.1 YlxQ-related RNA-binding protein [Fructilactobacillus cliffordii]USS89564.1 YlxQ-related RNA-binding protein [Fructilactobacillus cliffordii]
MTNYKQTLNLLGIARRAGKIVTGESLVLNGIRHQQVQFLFLASDAGAATAKRFLDKSRFYAVPVNNDLNKSELSAAIGQPRTVIGIIDQGFARKLNEINK